jgi:hypothetical protein
LGDDRFRVRTRWGRFVAYGLIGWCAEVAFTGVQDYVRTRDLRLASRSSLWIFPIYGLLAPLYEPLHDAMRNRVPAPPRAVVDGSLIMAIEYARAGGSGRRSVTRPGATRAPGGIFTGWSGRTTISRCGPRRGWPSSRFTTA